MLLAGDCQQCPATVNYDLLSACQPFALPLALRCRCRTVLSRIDTTLSSFIRLLENNFSSQKVLLHFFSRLTRCYLRTLAFSNAPLLQAERNLKIVAHRLLVVAICAMNSPSWISLVEHVRSRRCVKPKVEVPFTQAERREWTAFWVESSSHNVTHIAG